MALQSLVNGWSLGTQNTGPNLAGWCKPHAMDDLATLRSTWSVVKSNHSHNPAPGIIVLQKQVSEVTEGVTTFWKGPVQFLKPV